MKVEKILRKIPMFNDLELDIILFESKYPVLFTCKNGNNVYLFLCCLVTAAKAEWIGTKTTYDILIKLLENEITIRDAFLDGCKEKIIIEYDGNETQCKIVDKTLVPSVLLPTAGEYMDAEDGEYADEIAVFESRNKNLEFKIKPRVSNYYTIAYEMKNVALADEFFNTYFISKNDTIIDFGKISNLKIAHA